MLTRRRAIALMLVLITTSLVVVLMVAFLSINRANFSLVRASAEQERAYQACQSGYAYALMQLEHNRNWGTLPFPGNSDLSAAPNLRVQEVANTHQLTGSLSVLEQSFEVEVINRLELTTPHLTENCPAKAVLLKIVGHSHGFTRHLEATLLKAPFADSGAISNRTMRIDADRLYVSSKDPYRNLLRSNEDIYAPDAVTDSKILFLPKVGAPPPLDQPPHGALWAKGGIVSGTANLSNPSNLALAQASSKGTFLPGAARSQPISTLGLDDLVTNGTPPTTLPGGGYRFEELQQTVHENRAVDDGTGTMVWQGWQDVLVKTPALVHYNSTGVAEIHYLNDESLVTATAPDNDPSDFTLRNPGTWSLGGSTPPSPPIPVGTGQASETGAFVWPGSGVEFNLKTSDISIPDVDVTVPESVSFTSLNRPDPSLNLGRRVVLPDGTRRTDVGTLQVDGDVSVRGRVGGFGALIASQDISMMAQSQLLSSPERGVALYAGRDVNLRPNQSLLASGTQAFYGLVYAQRNFFFGDPSISGRWSVYIEGALVAHDGQITIGNASTTQFMYNPDYLNLVLKNLSEGRLRLDNVCWRI